MHVDSEDVDLVLRFAWYVDTNGYAVRTVMINRKAHRLLLHNEVMGGGNWLHDHVNRDRLDNRKENLRRATATENSANRGKSTRVTTSSRFKGVSLRKHSGKWRAKLRTGDRDYHLGHFDREEDAARAYNAKARELFGEFAFQNPL